MPASPLPEALKRNDRSADFVLTARCDDALGIVATLGEFLRTRDAFIVDSQQHGDPATGSFFSRFAFSGAGPRCPDLDGLRAAFSPLAERLGMVWSIEDARARPRILIAVSRFGHCLNDLLHRWRTGTLPVDIVGVVSNHDDMRSLTEWHGIAYHHLPMTPETKAEQEAALLDLTETLSVDLLVLARYMQVLSPELCRRLSWRCINIHHSFLPSFKGAKPYHQAHTRGVKIIGATAHYVTSDLDEGPIIEQDVVRVDHGSTSAALVEIGRDVEAVVLARAVRWHAERRVLPNGQRTVVFR